MTPESALSKLSYVLAKKDLDLAAKKKVCVRIQKGYCFELMGSGYMHRANHGGLFLVQMMAQNLRGEMSSDFAGTKLCLSDSRFIQVIAKSLSISCKEVRTPPTQTETAFHFTQQTSTSQLPNLAVKAHFFQVCHD